jgi:beta-alanine degradation protein BauB
MVSKLGKSVVFLCLAVTVVGAQDPTKTDPKHYKVAFENEHVQVVYVHYGPREKSPMHHHPMGVVVNINNARVRFTDEHGKTVEVLAKAGEARWFPPNSHQVENLTDAPYDAVYIGIKDNSGKNP